MSLVKKIKLTLLASAVMFSSKGVYAMMEADRDPETGSSMVLQQQIIVTPESSDLTPFNDEVGAMVARVTGINHPMVQDDQSREEMHHLINTIGIAEFKDRLQAIEDGLLKKLVNPSASSSIDAATVEGCYQIAANALLLPPEEITKRGTAIEKMINDLYTYYTPYPPGTFPCKTDEPLPPRELINCFSLGTSFNHITSALAETADEIKKRTDLISTGNNNLLPRDVDTRPTAIECLFKLEARDLVLRNIIMTGYHFSFVKRFNISYEEVKAAVSHLSNAELELKSKRNIDNRRKRPFQNL